MAIVSRETQKRHQQAEHKQLDSNKPNFVRVQEIEI
jgi:hypothetical protein